MPAISLISVLLPAPFGPTTHTSSRAPIASDTSMIAGAAPDETRVRSTSSLRFAQVRPPPPRPAHPLRRPAFGDHPPVAQHDDAVGELHHRAHDVLHEHDARALRPDLLPPRAPAI